MSRRSPGPFEYPAAGTVWLPGPHLWPLSTNPVQKRYWDLSLRRHLTWLLPVRAQPVVHRRAGWGSPPAAMPPGSSDDRDLRLSSTGGAASASQMSGRISQRNKFPLVKISSTMEYFRKDTP